MDIGEKLLDVENKGFAEYLCNNTEIQPVFHTYMKTHKRVVRKAVDQYPWAPLAAILLGAYNDFTKKTTPIAKHDCCRNKRKQ